MEDWKASSPTLRLINEFERQQLRNLLEKCTDGERQKFNLMYKSVDAIKKEKIPWAIKQCENTLKKKVLQ